MRTTAIVVGVLCLAVAAGVFSFAPLPGYADSPSDGVSFDEVQDRANDSAAEAGLNGSAETEGEGSLIGTIISGAQAVFDLVALVALVPTTLQSLGLPWWFAQPVGWATTIIGGVGAVQFATGRTYS